jgi:adenylate kinase family enzyme
MKRVLVIGSGGAGKSTCARALGEILDIPVVHLDAEFWRPGWERTPQNEWEARIDELVRGESWIMDGNFGGTRERRIRAADTIIFLDLPRMLCLYRVAKRAVRYYGRNRPDMAEGCDEKLDLEFLLWVWNYPNSGRVRTLRDLAKTEGKRVIVLKSRKAVKEFLDEQRTGER